jgi:hypothetical protein
MSNTSEIETRVKHLRGVLAEKGTEIKNLTNSWKDETGQGHMVLSTKQHGDYLKAVNDAASIRDEIAAHEKSLGIFEYLSADEGTPAAGRDAAERRGTPSVKTFSTEFLASSAYAEMKAANFKIGGQFAIERGLPDLAAAAAKDVYSAMGGDISIPVLGRAQDIGFTDRTLRPGRVRDLFPAERTQAAMLYGIRETGYTNRARTVAERTAADGGPATGGPTDVFGLKPKSELTITSQTYPIATIAHIMYVHRNTLNDEPRIRGILDRDMIDGVKMAEDEQILWGDGVGENLTGLMNTDGIQEYSGLASDRKSAQIRRAATRAILAYFQPTGVVMHPFDWEEIELETDNNGAYTVAVSVAVGGEKRVWRLAVTDSPAMRQGDALIGAFGTGAKLYDREEVNVQVSTENRDLFERNAYTLRAEERLGLVVDRPESFVHLDFTNYVRPAA